MKALLKITSREGGPCKAKRRMLGAVAESVILYAAPVWLDALKFGNCLKEIEGVQRKVQGSTCCNGGRWIHGSRIIPIDLLARERIVTVGKTDREKKDLRNNTIQRWQERWSEIGSDVWLHRIFPNITVWYFRTFGEVMAV